MNNEEALAVGRLKSGKIMGYIRRVLMSMQYKITAEVPTMAVDHRWRCYVNPEFLRALTPFGVAIILIHEGLHLLLDHPNRYANLCDAKGWPENQRLKNARLWNIACDAIINNMILLAGVSLRQWATHVGKNPDSGKPIGVFPEDVGETSSTINLLTSEELFNKLLNKKQEEEQGPEPQQDEGDTDDSESDGDQSDGQSDDQSDEESDEESGGQGEESEESDEESGGGSGGDDESEDESGDAGAGGGAGAGGDAEGEGGSGDELGNSSDLFGGSCSDGLSREYEDEDGTGNVSEPAANSIRKEVLAESKEWAKGRGFGSADMDIVWDELNEEPVVDWTEVISDFASAAGVTARGLVDYAYTEPHHLQAVFVPIIANTEQPTPRIYVGVDTSGSMFSEISHTVNEAVGILDNTPNPVRWFTCDSVVTDHGEVGCAEDIKLVGGGGTDMRDFFNHIDKLADDEGVQPDAVILFTDCETPWPEEAPPYECLIVDVRPGGYYKEYPEWAESVLSCPKK